MDTIRQAAEHPPGGVGIDAGGAIRLDHELGQRELSVDAIEQHAFLDVAGAQPVEAVDVVLGDHLVLREGEGERLPRREAQHDEPPGPRPLAPSAVDVRLRDGTIGVVAEQRRHRTKQILGHANVDLRVVALALLGGPRRSRIEPPNDLAHG